MEIELDITIINESEPISVIDLATEYLKEVQILSYPQLLLQFPDLDIRKFLHRVDHLIDRGHPLKRIEGKGFVYGDYSQDQSIELLRSKFIEDVITQADYCDTFIRQNIFGIEYILIQNSHWPLGIQNLLFITRENQTEIIEFQERSLSFPILKFLINNPRHVITNYQLAELVKEFGTDVKFFDSLTVYRWFDYLRTTYGIPLTSIQSMGWGMTNIQIKQKSQEADIQRKLDSEWRHVLITELRNIDCSTIGKVGDIKFYFPKLDMGYLPRHAFVLTRNTHGDLCVFDLQTLNSVKRTLESLVRNGGYIDRYTVSKHSHEDWWQNQLVEEQQRSNYITGENVKSKVIDVESEDGYDYAIKRLKDFLEENNLPKLLGHTAESGYVLDNVPKQRRNFIKQRMLNALKKILGKGLICEDLLKESGLEGYQIYSAHGLKLIIFDLNTLKNFSDMQMFQPSIYKTHGAIFIRDIYSSGQVTNIQVAVELNTSQAELLKQFLGTSIIDISQLTKRERDNVARMLSGIRTEIERAGFALECGSGIIEGSFTHLPLPTIAEG